MKKKNKRLNVLSTDEHQRIYERPRLQAHEQAHYFSLSKKQWQYAKTLHLASRVYFILQMGYFKAAHRFFSCHPQAVKQDIDFIMHTFFPNEKHFKKFPARNTQHKIHQKILAFTDYQFSPALAKKQIQGKLKKIIASYHDPTEMFRELMHFFEHKKQVLPGYSTLQDLIGQAILSEESRLKNTIHRDLPAFIKTDLISLLTIEKNYYKLTDLKHDLRNFNYGQMKKEIKKHHAYLRLYQFSEKFLPTLQISRQKIHYYASLATYYTPYKLKRMPAPLAHLYLLCFVFHRHQKMSNNITHAFLYKIDSYIHDARKTAEAIIKTERNELNVRHEDIGLLIGYYAEESMFAWNFKKVAEKAYETLPKKTIQAIKRHYMGGGMYKEQLMWRYYVQKQRAIAQNIRPIMKALHLGCDQENNPVFEAARFLQATLRNGKTLADVDQSMLPKRIITKQYQPYIIKGDKIDVGKYEFLIYYKLRKYIGHHKIYLNDTLQFKSFREDIKTTANWENERTNILKKLENPKLNANITKRLAALKNTLESLYKTVNKRIKNGDNKFINIVNKNGKKTWTLDYPSDKDEFDHKFYRNLSIVDIGDVFDFVNEKCHFMRALTHIKPRAAKGRSDYQYTKGCIIANGTRQGIDHMSTRSNLHLPLLKTNHANYVRLATITDACTILTNAIAKLPQFKKYNFQLNVNHASIDGSKHGSKKQTAKCRYSQKYFGLAKGVSALNMVLNSVPVHTKIIGANEHESHFSFDMYFNNETDVIPDMISTDTAGSNQLNFLFYDLVDVQYAPCYRSLADTMINNLVGFHDAEHYKHMLIKPKKKTNVQLIESEHENMQQVFAAMLMKETTQHVVVKKLACRENASKLKRAMWEYNKILFSIYMLNYVDDPMLRRAVRIALNIGENYHKLYNAVAKVGGKKFRGTSDVEIEIWHQCTRLLTLVIIYYNVYLLSVLGDSKVAAGDEEAAALLFRISPLAIRHINLGGLYYYADDNDNTIDIPGMIAAMSDALEELREKRRKK